MLRLFTLLLLLTAGASAQDAPAADDGGELDEDELAPVDDAEADRLFGEPDAEIIVFDVSDPERARAEVEERLLDLGYTRSKRRGDRVVYTHPVNYKPKVIIHDDGFMYMRRQPPRIAAPELGGPMADVPVLKWTPCLLIPTLCVRAGGWTITPRKYAHHKQFAVEAVEQPLRDYGDALAANALQERIYEELPAQLDLIWYAGVHPADARELSTFAERRAAILEIWLNRADNEYGDAVREAIELYMAYEVNASEHPYTAEELRQANLNRRCKRELKLPETSW